MKLIKSKDSTRYNKYFPSRKYNYQSTKLGWSGAIPSLVRTEESGEEGTKFVRGLFSLGTGRGLRAGGVKAGSIFQGDTLSGRGMLEDSSQRTFKPKKHK